HIEPVQIDIRQQGRYHSPLRGSFVTTLGRLALALLIFLDDRGAEPAAYQLQYAAICDTHPHTGHQLVMRDAVEVTFQIGVVDLTETGSEVVPDFAERVVRPAARAESM